MKLLKQINQLPWKYVAGINIGVVALAITFTSITSVNNTTENRSQAKEALPTPIMAFAVNPLNPPELITPEPTWAKVGDAILVKGKNLGSVPFGTLKLGEIVVSHDNLIAWEPNQIVFTVPEGASTAPISIVTITTSGEPLELTTSVPLTITTSNQN